jgi:drug/metabolite transporter (DMT)-like permease
MNLAAPYLGEVAALAAAVCWTVTALAFESAGRRIGSLAVNLIRLVIALGFLTVFCWLQRGRALPTDASSFQWLVLGLSGLVGFTFGDLCLFRALVVLGARLSMLLMAMVPPLTALLGLIFLGEQLTPLHLLGMAITVSGVVVVVAGRRAPGEAAGPRLPLTGLLLGLGGALGQAGGLILSKVGVLGYHPFAATQIRVIVGAAGFAVIFAVIGWFPRVIAGLKDRRALAQTALGGVFGPFLGVSLSLVAVKYAHAGVAATLMGLVPVLILVPSVWLGRERLTARAVIGAVVAVAGSALLFL